MNGIMGLLGSEQGIFMVSCGTMPYGLIPTDGPDCNLYLLLNACRKKIVFCNSLFFPTSFPGLSLPVFLGARLLFLFSVLHGLIKGALVTLESSIIIYLLLVLVLLVIYIFLIYLTLPLNKHTFLAS